MLNYLLRKHKSLVCDGSTPGEVYLLQIWETTDNNLQNTTEYVLKSSAKIILKDLKLEFVKENLCLKKVYYLISPKGLNRL